MDGLITDFRQVIVILACLVGGSFVGILITRKWMKRENKFQTLVNQSQDMIFSCDLDGTLWFINRQIALAWELDPSHVMGKQIWEFKALSYSEGDWKLLIRDIVQTGSSVYLEKKIVMPSGASHTFHVTLTPLLAKDGHLDTIMGTFRDITAIKHKEHHIQHLAYYDQLTDLPNRHALTELLKERVSGLHGDKRVFSLILLDIDNFKRMNDSRGHAFGDELLREAGVRLRSNLAEAVHMGRFDGDMFMIVFDEMHEDMHVKRQAEQLSSMFHTPFHIQGEQVYLSISTGAANFPRDGETAEELLKNAVTALHMAKATGKNNALIFNTSMKESVMKKAQLEEELRKAWELKQFHLVYQPLFDIFPFRLRGFEALLRWNSPKLGAISPTEFIRIAEETGLIVPIGEWVLREACLQNKRLQQTLSPNSIISVNVSSYQLRDPLFYNTVVRVLEETELSPSSLELEITESAAITSLGESIALLNRFNQIGVTFALDDFGTGYSSLSYLKQLPIHQLKIDKSFIQDISATTSATSITETIIMMVHKLGLHVVAEGIENKEQLSFLTEWGCDCVQGYLLSRPLLQQDIAGFIHGMNSGMHEGGMGDGQMPWLYSV